MAYRKLQQRKKKESEKLRGGREISDQIKFIDLRFERWQVVGLRKARRQELHVLGMNDNCEIEFVK